MSPEHGPYYRRDLALAHHLGYGFHAEACAPGILALLEPVRARGGLVLELGCGSGLLTRELIGAGHRVIATDASPAILGITITSPVRRTSASSPCRMTRCHQPTRWSRSATCSATCPTRTPSPPRSRRSRGRCGRAGCLRSTSATCPTARTAATPRRWAGEDLAIISATALPVPDRFIRQITVFMRNDDSSWRRDDERHDNVLIDTARVPGLLAGEGVEVNVTSAFGTERLPTGLAVLVGRRA